MNTQRRHDLDWVRVLVFSLLIFYHVGMFFVPWEWHIQNNDVSYGMRLPMWFVNQWRLPLLFLISGMGTRFALSSRSLKEYITERHNRLVIPLIFGMIVIIAPQVYVERMVNGAGYSSFLDFYPHYFSGVYPEGNFSWHHLWFLPYLFVYSVILSPVFIRIRSNPDSPVMLFFKKALTHKTGLFLLAVPLVLTELFLKPQFPVTHNLVNDWYAFAFYLIPFLYGYLFISAGEAFWNTMSRNKLPALLTGMLTFSLMVWIDSLAGGIPAISLLFPLVKVINLGAWIIAITGYSAALLNRPSRILTYCNQAVYPFYIIHQTITVVAAYYIYEAPWPISWKFLFLTAITFGGSWIFYEIVKRFTLTRILFGIKQKKKPKQSNLQRKLAEIT